MHRQVSQYEPGTACVLLMSLGACGKDLCIMTCFAACLPLLKPCFLPTQAHFQALKSAALAGDRETLERLVVPGYQRLLPKQQSSFFTFSSHKAHKVQEREILCVSREEG